mmetsp:Transcript_96037/g.215116  ORF Transcript_96037/g.215116 Transcript_96037/m.215116 type:complete len:389 (-) Transcript_96037:4916-6082(-)
MLRDEVPQPRGPQGARDDVGAVAAHEPLTREPSTDRLVARLHQSGQGVLSMAGRAARTEAGRHLAAVAAWAQEPAQPNAPLVGCWGIHSRLQKPAHLRHAPEKPGLLQRLRDTQAIEVHVLAEPLRCGLAAPRQEQTDLYSTRLQEAFQQRCASGPHGRLQQAQDTAEAATWCLLRELDSVQEFEVVGRPTSALSKNFQAIGEVGERRGRRLINRHSPHTVALGHGLVQLEQCLQRHDEGGYPRALGREHVHWNEELLWNIYICTEPCGQWLAPRHLAVHSEAPLRNCFESAAKIQRPLPGGEAVAVLHPSAHTRLGAWCTAESREKAGLQAQSAPTVGDSTRLWGAARFGAHRHGHKRLLCGVATLLSAHRLRPSRSALHTGGPAGV